MTSKDSKEKKPALSELKKIIGQIEDKENPLNKFKNTEIYGCYKYLYNFYSQKLSNNPTK